jgi:hypothetical protein
MCATSISAAGDAHLDEDLFVAQFTRHFTIMTREELTNGRVLFLFEKK